MAVRGKEGDRRSSGVSRPVRAWLTNGEIVRVLRQVQGRVWSNALFPPCLVHCRAHDGRLEPSLVVIVLLYRWVFRRGCLSCDLQDTH